MISDIDLDSIIGQVLFNEVLTPESLKRNTREGDNQLKLPLSVGHRAEVVGFVLGVSWVASNLETVASSLEKADSLIAQEMAVALQEFAKGMQLSGTAYALELWPDFPSLTDLARPSQGGPTYEEWTKMHPPGEPV